MHAMYLKECLALSITLVAFIKIVGNKRKQFQKGRTKLENKHYLIETLTMIPH